MRKRDISGIIRSLSATGAGSPGTMCFVYIRRAKRKGAGLQTGTHADIHTRSVIHSASQTHTSSYNVASKPRRIGGPTRHLFPAKWTTCLDGSPVRPRRSLPNKPDESSSLRPRIARTGALLSASSSGHSLLRNNLSQKWKQANKQTKPRFTKQTQRPKQREVCSHSPGYCAEKVLGDFLALLYLNVSPAHGH